MKFAAGFLILGFVASACVFADTYYVDNGDNIQGNAGLLGDIIIYPNIQAAIDDSNDGDTVIIMPGLYTGEGNRDIDFKGKAITVRGSDPNDSNVVEATIIDCNGTESDNHRGFTFENGEGPDSVLSGLTVINGYYHSGTSGIRCSGSSPQINNCIIRDCNGYSVNVISCDESNPQIKNCIIRDCNAFFGSVIACGEGDPQIINCVIQSCNRTGGAVITCGRSNVQIINCIVQDCTGRGIECWESNPKIINSLIRDCTDRGIFCDDSYAEIVNCTILGNSADSDGAGIFMDFGGIIDGCMIASNRTSSGEGGGVYGIDIVIKNSVIKCNTAPSYAGVRCSSKIYNCTIAYNKSNSDTDVYLIRPPSFYSVIANSIVWGDSRTGDVPITIFPLDEHSSSVSNCIMDEDANDEYIPFSDYGFGNIDDYPQFVREPNDGGDGFGDDPNTPVIDEGANDDLGDLHLTKISPCINAGIPNYIAAADELDVDEEPRIIGGRVDMGADEYAPMITVLVPQGGEVWAADSNHTIVWTGYGAGEKVDIQLSDNNGLDWDVVADDVNNDDSFLLNLPETVDSNQCIIKVVPTVPDANVLCMPSGLFTIQPYNPDEPVESLWQTLGKDYYRRGLSDFNGPQVGCVKWVFDTNGPVTAGVAAGDTGQVYAACRDGNLYAIDSNGNLFWKYDANTPLLSTPSIGRDGTVYVGGENSMLYAIDKNGQLRWTHTTGAYVSASPAVSFDGKIFAASQDGKLYALAPEGSELWEFATAGLGKNTKGSIIGSPAIDSNGVVYVAGLYDPNLYALDANNGEVIWSCLLQQPPIPPDLPPECPRPPVKVGNPAVSPVIGLDGTIYMLLIGDHHLYAVEPNDGSIKWSLNLADTRSYWFGPEFSDCYYFSLGSSNWRYGKWYKSECFSEPVIGPDGTIYVSFDDPYLRAISPDGMVKWLTRLGMVGGFTLGVGSNGLVYVGSDDGAVYVVDVNGVEISRFVVNDVDIFSYPAIPSEGQLIVSDSNNRIWSISESNCEVPEISLFRPEDLYSDGIINFKDFALLAMDWLECTDRYFGRFDGSSSLGHCDYEGYKIYFEGDVNRDLFVDDNDLTNIKYNWLNAERLVYEKPRIKITNPKNGDYFEPSDEVIIEIDAYDPDGSIVRVELLRMDLLDYYPNVSYYIIDEDLDGSDGWGPFIVNGSIGENSTYRYILVRAVDDDGFASYSEVKIDVKYFCVIYH